ncbi:MAG: tyrosine-type recombinase/integrase [Promethearchaeota archaeon]
MNRLKSNQNNIESYYYKELNGLSDGAILNHLITIGNLFENDQQRIESCRKKNKDFSLEHNNISIFTEQDMKDFLNCEWWNNPSSSTKNMHLNRIKNYLRFSDRQDLISLLPKKINGKAKKPSKNDLILRVDLTQILKNCNLKYRTLIMLIYVAALRINEAVNIKRQDIRFNMGFIILKVSESKTYSRDVPLIESIPYLKEYLESNDFDPEDLLFEFKNKTM